MSMAEQLAELQRDMKLSLKLLQGNGHPESGVVTRQILLEKSHRTLEATITACQKRCYVHNANRKSDIKWWVTLALLGVSIILGYLK